MNFCTFALIENIDNMNWIHHQQFLLGPGGKKNRQKERRLMKGYNLGNSHSSAINGTAQQQNTNQEKTNHCSPAENKSNVETKIEINCQKKGSVDYLCWK